MERTLKIIAKTATKRFFELLLINTILSAVVTALNFTGFIKTQDLIFISTSLGVFLSMFINIQFMRKYYYDLASKMTYYPSNYIAHLLFLAVNLAVGAIFDNNVYAWLFSITKFARFSHLEWGSLTSAILFNCLMILSIHIAPVGMGWIVLEEDYED